MRPVVQLIPHDGPVPFPPDAATVMFFVGKHVPLWFGELHDGIGGVLPCSFASPKSQSIVFRSLSRSVLASASGRSHFGFCASHFPVIGLYT